MGIRSSSPIVLVFIAALALLSSPAEGADRQDPEFGQRLLERGWTNWAARVFSELSKSGGSETLRLQGRLGLLKVFKARADREANAEKRMALYEKAIQEYTAYLRESQDRDGQFQLAEILRIKGADLIRRARESLKSEERSRLLREGRAEFRRAQDLLHPVLEQCRKKTASLPGGRAALPKKDLEVFQRAQFLQAELPFELGCCLAEKSPERTRALRDAIRLLEDYIWDWEEYFSVFEAYLLRGRCFLSLGSIEAALESYRTVLLVSRNKKAASRAQIFKTVRQRACHRILESLNTGGQHALAVREGSTLSCEFPAIKGLGEEAPNQPHASFILEWARALGKTGSVSRAVQLLVKLLSIPGRHLSETSRLLNIWGARDPNASVEVHFQRGQGCMTQHRYPEAVEAFEDAVRVMADRGKPSALLARTWHQIGLAYAYQKRYFEAGAAFEEGMASWEELASPPAAGKNWGAECAYRGYHAYRRAYKNTGDTVLKDRSAGLLQSLTTRYGDSPYARSQTYYAARELCKEGRFSEALTLLKRIVPGSPFFEDSQVRIGRCLFEISRGRLVKRTEAERTEYLNQAEKTLQAVLTRMESSAVTGGEAVQRRKSAKAWSVYYLGRIAHIREQWDVVSSRLAGFEDRFSDQPAELILSAAFLRIRAACERKDDRRAVDMAGLIEQSASRLKGRTPSAPPHAYCVAAWQMAGKLFCELAARAETENDADLVSRHTDRAAHFLLRWIRAVPSPRLSDLDTVGIWLSRAGKFGDAVLLYERLLKGISFLDPLPPGKSAVVRRLGECRIRLGDWAGALPLFEALNRPPNNRAREGLLQIHEALGDEQRKVGAAAKALQHYEKAIGLSLELSRNLKPEKKAFWVKKLGFWELLFKKGAYPLMVTQIIKARMMYPLLGGPNLRKRALELLEQGKQRAGAQRPGKRKKKKK